MNNKLINGKLMVQGESIDGHTDLFEVVIDKLRDDFMLEITLEPTEDTREKGIGDLSYTVDTLNETVIQALEAEGFTQSERMK